MPTPDTYATSYHVPIMVDQVLDYLAVDVGGRYVDATVGGGGHTAAILDRSAPDGQVLGIDRDPEAIAAAGERLEPAGQRLTLVRGNYGDVVDICRAQHVEPVDGLLVDAGVSSHQLDDAERGFSFRRAGPLDMRMGPSAPSLHAYLESVDVDALADALGTYGEVRAAGRVARAILDAFNANTLETTLDLTAVVEATIGGGGGRRVHPATLVFQGLRIALNNELDALERAVDAVPTCVESGGRAVFISFHSLEDRIVKHGLRELANDCVCPPDFPVCGCDAVAQVEVLTSGPIRAGEAELERNPRARSARLRAARVL